MRCDEILAGLKSLADPWAAKGMARFGIAQSLIESFFIL
jgi:hypothetical protein